MLLSDLHMMSELKELWGFKSFRLRIFMTIAPTLIAICVGYYALDSMHPYEFLAEGSSIEPPAGKGGDQMTVRWHVVHNRYCDGIVERQLVDPNTDVVLAVYEAAPAALNGMNIGNNVLTKTFTLPRSLQAGRVAYLAKLTYTCNWLQAFFPNAFGIKYNTPKLLFTYEP